MAPSADLAIDRSAVVERIALGTESWVDLVRGFVRHPREELDDIVATTQWGQTEVLRYDRYVPENRLGAALQPESRTLLRQTDRYTRVQLSINDAAVQRAKAEHEELVTLCKRGEAREASALLKRHIEHAGEELILFLQGRRRQ